MEPAGTDRAALIGALRNDPWFRDGWHRLGMERAVYLIESGAGYVISPQEPGVNTTSMDRGLTYWRQHIGDDIVNELEAHACHIHFCRDEQHTHDMECVNPDCRMWLEAARVVREFCYA